MYFNQQIAFVGNIGRDAEVREGIGNPFMSTAIAVNKKLRDGTRRTMWVQLTKNTPSDFEKKMTQKSSQWLVEGYLKTDEEGNPRTYTDRNGVIKAKFELQVTNMVLLKSAEEVALLREARGFDYNNEDFGPVDEAEDDIPF